MCLWSLVFVGLFSLVASAYCFYLAGVGDCLCKDLFRGVSFQLLGLFLLWFGVTQSQKYSQTLLTDEGPTETAVRISEVPSAGDEAEEAEDEDWGENGPLHFHLPGVD